MSDYINLGVLLNLPGEDSKVPTRIEPESLATHTVVVGQYGSGKSFFLGRLVEEIICKTSARVIVLDPGSDFVRISEVNRGVWRDEKFKKYFSAEDTLRKFRAEWERKKSKIISISSRSLDVPYEPLKINWGDLDISEMVSFLDIDLRDDYDLFMCLESNVAMADMFFKYRDERKYDFACFHDYAERILKTLVLEENCISHFESYGFNKVLVNTIQKESIARYYTLISRLSDYEIWLNENDVEDGKLDISEILNKRFFKRIDPCQLTAINLQALKSSEAKLLVVFKILSLLWNYSLEKQSEEMIGSESVERRDPLILVIDDSQNFIPCSTDNPLLRKVSEQITRIAVEGRKYGIYLIIATQRPQKIHPDVLSECDNVCLMSLKNEADLACLGRAAGFLPAEIARKALSLKTGDALLAGRMVDYSPLAIHASPRRTLGGRSELSCQWTK